MPIRFINRNKLTTDDKLLLVFDAFVLSEMLGRTVRLGKIIPGDAILGGAEAELRYTIPLTSLRPDALIVISKIAEFTNPGIYGEMQIG